MTQQPLVSVIIPTFNRRHCIARALDSVFAQTHSNLQVLVIDDGSTDDTMDFIQATYPLVELHTQTNQGVSHARNQGIKRAQGNWIALLDSDDAWLPDKITQQITALQDNPDEYLCHTEEIWYRHHRRVNPMHKHQKYGGWIYPRCLERCLISPSSVLIKKELFDQVGHFDEHLPACEDYDLWLRITAFYPVLFLSTPLTIKYGGHADQLSRRYWGMDRFRIQALQAMLQNTALSKPYREQTEHILRDKIQVYLQGAKKRHKYDDIQHYTELLHSLTP